MVGTARCAVRAAFSGATSVAGDRVQNVSRALRAVTAVAAPLAKSAVPPIPALLIIILSAFDELIGVGGLRAFCGAPEDVIE